MPPEEKKHRAKSENKLIKKRIEKMMEKRCVLEASRVGSNTRAMVPQGSLDPLITNFQRKPQTTAHSPKNNQSRPARNSAVADNIIAGLRRIMGVLS